MKLSLFSVLSLLLAFAQRGGATGVRRPLFMYINAGFADWSDPCLDIKHMIDEGVTEVILAFWMHATGPVDAAIAWDGMTPAQKSECLTYAHDRGAKILLAAAGATEIPYVSVSGEEYGRAAAKATYMMGLDGLDFDLENLTAHFGNDPTYYNWIRDASLSARAFFDTTGRKERMLITHAPQAPYFTDWAGSNKGYLQLMKDLGESVDYYLIQYYNQGSCEYLTYDSIFTATEAGCWSAGASILEIKAALGPAHEHLWTKLVVGKPATIDDVMNTGMVQPVDLVSAVCTAEANDGYAGGIMAWSYRGLTHAAMNVFFASMSPQSCNTSGGGVTPAPSPGPTLAPVPEATTELTTAPGTLPPTTGGGKCFHNEAGFWWTNDCSHSSICMEDLSFTSSDACLSSGLPQSVWVGSVDECRAAVHAAGGCTSLPAGTPAPTAIPVTTAEPVKTTTTTVRTTTRTSTSTARPTTITVMRTTYASTAPKNTTTTAVPTPTTATPVTGGKKCFHNLQNVWWAGGCSDASLCVEDTSITTERDCLSSGFPHAQWVSSVEDCRTAVHAKSGCAELAAAVPDTPTGPAGPTGGVGCYHNAANVWWTADCNSPQLCVFDVALKTDGECNNSGFPYSHFGTEAECRSSVKQQGACSS